MSFRFSIASCARRASRLALPLCAGAVTLTACGTPPSAVQPVLASSSQASQAIANAYARDLAWLRQHINSSLDTQRAILLGRTHRALITDALITPLGHDPQALNTQIDAAIASGETPSNPLIADVISGHITRAEAERFLNDYAVAAAMSQEQSRSIRHAMLATLAPLRDHDRNTRTLLQAFSQHAHHIAELFTELSANNHALAEAFNAPQQTHATIRQRAFWRPILDHIEDPLLRAAAEELLQSTGTLPNTPPGPDATG